MGIVGKVLVGALVIGALAFAVQGGEYGTTDLFSQRARRRQLAAQIDSLSRQVDSLRVVKRRLATDATLQERIAREEFGMVRGDKELLYRFTDSAPPQPVPTPADVTPPDTIPAR